MAKRSLRKGWIIVWTPSPKFQYDIWEDVVNTASHKETSGEMNKMNICQTTYKLLKTDSDFTFKSRGKIEVKGKGPMDMYFVEKAYK